MPFSSSSFSDTTEVVTPYILISDMFEISISGEVRNSITVDVGVNSMSVIVKCLIEIEESEPRAINCDEFDPLKSK